MGFRQKAARFSSSATLAVCALACGEGAPGLVPPKSGPMPRVVAVPALATVPRPTAPTGTSDGVRGEIRTRRRPETEGPATTPVPPPDPVAAPAEPDPARFGRAFHFLTRVVGDPLAPEERPPGYLRRGARFLAHRAPSAGPGCAAGWHALLTGGYVCPGEGVVIGDAPPPEPQTAPPPPPDEGRGLPYRYARVGTSTWELSSLPEGRAAWEDLPPAAPPAPADGAEGDAVALSSPLPDEVRGPLAAGWFVSVSDEVLTGDGLRFLRTLRGTFVAASATAPVADPPPSAGVRLSPSRGVDLPLAIARRHDGARTRAVGIDGTRGPVRTVPWGRGIPLRPGGDAPRGGPWVETADGRLLRSADVRVARARVRPDSVGEADRWIHVDLSEQVLVAYEGDVPRFAALVSTGRPSHPTPTGVFPIDGKHLTTTMDGDADDPAEEAYRIDDVPWVQYFEAGYALHGAFWHQGFGTPRSHGCVNLAPEDARWLFRFTTPGVPPGWHGRLRARGEATTMVVIEP